METTKTVAKTRRKAARKPKGASPLTPAGMANLQAAADRIAIMAQDHLDTLVLELAEGHGLQLKQKDGRVMARMHGIDGSPAIAAKTALQNWAQAARRALLAGEV